MSDARRLALERTVRTYPVYAAAFSSFAWMPVFFLYFSERLPLADVLRLEAIYYAVVVLLEVPSGYFSDRIGRRASLLVSTTALIASYGLFTVGEPYGVLVAAQVLLAAGIAFNSGSDTSLHYDALVALDREGEYADREARVGRNTFVAGAAAALGGGVIGLVDLRFAYALSLVAALVALLVMVQCVEPERAGKASRSFARQVTSCMRLMRRPMLGWYVAFAVVMIVLNHIPYEFYQPYIQLALEQGEGVRMSAPVAGAHMAAAMLVGSWVASRSIAVRDRIGVVPTLLAATTLQVLVIAGMGSILSMWLVPLILLRVAPRALMTAPLRAAVAPLVPPSRRATFLSLQSLAGRLSFSATLFGLSAIAGAEVTSWPALSHLQRVAAVGALVLLTLLSLTALLARRPAR